MNIKRQMQLIIKSSLSRPARTYPIEIDASSTVFQLKKEIEKIEKASAEWIVLHNPNNFWNELKDDLIVSNIKLEAGQAVWAEFRYKFDESLPKERLSTER